MQVEENLKKQKQEQPNPKTKTIFNIPREIKCCNYETRSRCLNIYTEQKEVLEIKNMLAVEKNSIAYCKMKLKNFPVRRANI